MEIAHSVETEGKKKTLRWWWWRSCTFVDGDDVWMTERRHDLNFSANMDQVLLVLDLLLPNGLYGNLSKGET